MTRVTLETMREGKLTKTCNKEGSVVTVMNKFYVAIFVDMYIIW